MFLLFFAMNRLIINICTIIHTNLKNNMSVKLKLRDSSVDIAKGYGLYGLGSIPIKGKKFVSALQRPDGIRGPPSLLSNGYRELFSGVKATGT
jgi:hypothetical protein